MRKLSCAAILFDLDGVLVESRPVVECQWGIWANEHGLDAAGVIHIAHGRPTIETVRKVAPRLDAPAEAKKIEQREIADLDGLRAMPGAAGLLARIPPDRWAVVTSGTRALATTRLRASCSGISPWAKRVWWRLNPNGQRGTGSGWASFRK